MKFFILALAFLQTPVPKNNPAGIWEANTGSRFEIQPNGGDLQVKMVPGSNPKFLNYELTLKNQGEVNTYKGTGTFTAKMESGRECKFNTEWMFVVVSPERIIGSATDVQADKRTCQVKEKSQVQLDLKKKK